MAKSAPRPFQPNWAPQCSVTPYAELRSLTGVDLYAVRQNNFAFQFRQLPQDMEIYLLTNLSLQLQPKWTSSVQCTYIAS